MLIQGDARRLPLVDGCVDTVVTSPPYFGLRDYGTAAQIGLEPTPDAFVAALVAVFQDVRRVLKDCGTVWLNLGDSYANDAKWGGSSGGKHVTALHGQTGIGRGKRDTGAKPKDLLGIPWLVAFALRADGWFLRSDIVWSKPNPMPESVTDRPTRAHEYVFLLSKSDRYWYDAAAIREPYAPSTLAQFEKPYTGQGTKAYAAAGVQNPSDVKRRITDKQRGHSRRHAGFNDRWDAMPKQEQQMGGANKRSVWTIATRPYAGAHFATMPEKLVEPCILAGCPLYVCSKCGLAVDLDRVKTKLSVVQEALSHLPVSAEGPGEVLQQGVRLSGETGTAREMQGVQSADPVRKVHQDECVLQPDVREQVRRKDTPDDQGLQPDRSRVSSDLQTWASDGDANGLRARASAGNVGNDRASTVADGSGASQERCEVGQPAGEPRSPSQEDSRHIPEAEANTLSAVSIVLGRDLSIPQCAGCGSDLVSDNVRPGLVLDPFSGSGTVLAVAERLGRRGVGVDLNPAYHQLAKKRTAQRGLRWGA